MAKPYRRRKGKSGPYVGNYRCTVDGRDINLQTKDGHEALARARLASKGKWPPIPAAVEAARAALDPGNTDPGPPPDAGPAGVATGAVPHADPPATHTAPVQEQPSHEEAPDLNAAAQAAAAEASGQGGPDPEVQAEQESAVNAELAGIMAELTGGQSGGDLLDGLCDGVGAFLLWAEVKGAQLGVNWVLARRKSTLRLETKPPEQADLMRKCLRVGLKGMAVTYFPNFAQQLSPGWAIAIGLTGGAVGGIMNGKLIDTRNGTSQTVVDAVSEVRAQAQAAAEQPSPPPAPPAS